MMMEDKIVANTIKPESIKNEIELTNESNH